MSTKLYVGNLPDSVKEKDLRELFSSFGEVDEIAVFKGYGFVHFSKPEDATTALTSLDETDFMGSTIQVQVARTKGHGYGRGSGPPRPRPGSSRGPPGGDSYRRSGRDSYRDGYRESYRDNYRDSYRDRERGRYGGTYDAPREYDRYGGSGRNYGGEYYDRTFDRGYDRTGGGYDRYDDRYRGYDKGYERYDGYYEDYGRGGRYSDYRARSRSPPREYYGSGRERGYERDPYYSRDRKW